MTTLIITVTLLLTTITSFVLFNDHDCDMAAEAIVKMEDESILYS